MLIGGIALAVLGASLFAGSNVFNRRASLTVPAPEAVALGLSLNVLLLLPVLGLVAVATGATWPPWQAIVLYALSGVFGGYLGRLSLYSSMGRIGPSRASMTKNSSPVFVVLVGGPILDQWPTPAAAAGIALILAGLLYVGWAEEERTLRQATPANGRGLLIAFAAALTFGVSDIMRALAIDIHGNVVTATIFALLGGWAVAVGPAWTSLAGQARDWRKVNPDLLRASLLMGTAQLATFAAISLMYVSYVTALVATAPLFTALFSRLIARGDEVLTQRLVTSMLTVIAGGVLIAFYG